MLTIALSWSNAPAGTREFALMMTTLPGLGTTKWNWVLYGIPATAAGLAKNSSGIGTLGVGSDGPQAAYQPPCSQGPGAKLYTYTQYALSASPTLPVAAGQDDRKHRGVSARLPLSRLTEPPSESPEPGAQRTCRPRYSTTATIAWTTDQALNSQVEFGLTTAYGGKGDARRRAWRADQAERAGPRRRLAHVLSNSTPPTRK
jgi:hypothetical protein